jgi:enoyl-CoA hydratase/carnithine racemase
LTGEVVNGEIARQLGIVQWAVPRAELPVRAGDIARRVAALPAAALAEAKACLASARDLNRNGYSDELEATRHLLATAETRRRVHAFFEGAAANASQRKRGAM